IQKNPNKKRFPETKNPVTPASAAKSGTHRKTLRRRIGLEQETIFLVSLQSEMSGGGNHAVERAEFFRNEPRDFAKIPGVDDDHEIVSTAGEIAGDHLVEPRNAQRKAIKTAAAFRSYLHFDER